MVVVSIAGIVCQAYNVLCSSESYNFQFASVYLSIIDFISITYVFSLLLRVPFLIVSLALYVYGWAYRIALYGLILFYGLTREELKGRRPLAKFLSIKLIVMFTFYQEFVVRLSLFFPLSIFPLPYIGTLLVKQYTDRLLGCF